MNYQIAKVVVWSRHLDDPNPDGIMTDPVDTGMRMCDLWDPLSEFCGNLEEEGHYGEIVNEHSRIAGDPYYGNIFHIELFNEPGETERGLRVRMHKVLDRVCQEFAFL